jgi:nitrogen PTS system EIIA component
MQLTIQDAAKLFSVSEKMIYTWIDTQSLPGYKIDGQYRFNRAEVINWAMTNRIDVSPDIFKEPESAGMQIINLCEAIQTGGIYYGVKAQDKNSALRFIVELMRLPAEVNRELLFSVLLEREKIASTGIGEGIAIPHVRNPILVQVPKPIVSLCFLEKPIDFQSIDRQPVFCLFTMLSPSIRVHLHLLSRLSFALRDEKLKEVIKTQAPCDQIIYNIARIETELDKTK